MSHGTKKQVSSVAQSVERLWNTYGLFSDVILGITCNF
jgi:hypothetical protein